MIKHVSADTLMLAMGVATCIMIVLWPALPWNQPKKRRPWD